MPPTVSDIIETFEGIAPHRLAEKWDNVGLQIGHEEHLVRHIWVALDPSLEVVTAACENSIDLLITHHPLFFSPIKVIDLNTPIGAIVERAIQCNLSIYACHTNLDSVGGGLNDMLADRIGLSQRTVLLPSEVMDVGSSAIKHGLGRIGNLDRTTDLSSFGNHLKNALGLNSIRIVGQEDMPVVRVAICTGSGSSLIPSAIDAGADVLVTGDIRYHDATSAIENHLGLIDMGHFNSEHIMVDGVTNILNDIIMKNNWPIRVSPCKIEKDPFKVL